MELKYSWIIKKLKSAKRDFFIQGKGSFPFWLKLMKRQEHDLKTVEFEVSSGWWFSLRAKLTCFYFSPFLQEWFIQKSSSVQESSVSLKWTKTSQWGKIPFYLDIFVLDFCKFVVFFSSHISDYFDVTRPWSYFLRISWFPNRNTDYSSSQMKKCYMWDVWSKARSRHSLPVSSFNWTNWTSVHYFVLQSPLQRNLNFA